MDLHELSSLILKNIGIPIMVSCAGIIWATIRKIASSSIEMKAISETAQKEIINISSKINELIKNHEEFVKEKITDTIHKVDILETDMKMAQKDIDYLKNEVSAINKTLRTKQ